MTMGAYSVFLACAIVALGMLAAFGMLLVRRWHQERRGLEDREKLAAITRSYMRRVAGQIDDVQPSRWSDQLRLRAVSHIHLLLRGGERHRLMQIAELDGLLRAAIRRSRSWRSARRIDAIRFLQQFGSEVCIARLREMFARDRNRTVRLEAAFALASVHALPPPRETIRILGMFDRKSNRLDHALFRATASLYPEQMALILNDPISPDHFALVIDALGWSESASVLPILEEASRSDHAEIRASALQAAGQLGIPSVQDWVLERLEDPVEFVRIQAVNCCMKLQLRDAVPRLNTLLDDEALWVRLRAEQALDVLEFQWPSFETRGLIA